jgi:hypothetical protein
MMNKLEKAEKTLKKIDSLEFKVDQLIAVEKLLSVKEDLKKK